MCQKTSFSIFGHFSLAATELLSEEAPSHKHMVNGIG